MTTFYLIRHAEKDVQDLRIPGRISGVHLSEFGRHQATQLADVLAGSGISAIYSSPMERAQETARPLAERLGLEVKVHEGFHEIEFGDWSNKTLDELEQIGGWKLFNTFRSSVRIPSGETMFEVQTRFVRRIQELCGELGEQTAAIFSHSDPIKTVLAFYLGIPLDLCERLEIHPASVSILKVLPWGARVQCINQVWVDPAD